MLLGRGQWIDKVRKIKKEFKMLVTNFLELILVNLMVLIPNLNVTKPVTLQFLRN